MDAIAQEQTRSRSAADGGERTSVRLVPLADRAAWDEALAGIPHAFAHTWVNCQVVELSTGTPIHLFVWEGPEGRVVCPVAERAFGDDVDVVTPYGFSGFAGASPAPGADAAWRAMATARGWVCAFIQMNPLLDAPFQLHDSERHVYKDVYVFDLELDEGQLFANLPRSRRRAVHRWGRSGARFVDEPDRLIEFGRREYPRFLERRGATGGAPIVGTEAWRGLIEAPNTVAFGAEVDGQLVAINVLGTTPTVADDVVLVSLPGYEHLSMAFQWEGIRRLKRLGVARLNIGGGVRPGDGVEQFKQDLGARAMPLAALRQVFDRDRFAELCRRTGVPEDLDFFPAYRAVEA